MRNISALLSRKLWVNVFRCVLLLSIAPVLVGVGETATRKFPETDPFFAFLKVNLLNDVILPSVTLPIALLGGIGWLIVFIPTRPRFMALTPSVKLMITGVLAMFSILTLWFGIVWANWIVICKQHYYWNQLWGCPYPHLELWVFAIGFVWTIGISATTVHFGKQLIHK